jgi:hypothetical protein
MLFVAIVASGRHLYNALLRVLFDVEVVPPVRKPDQEHTAAQEAPITSARVSSLCLVHTFRVLRVYRVFPMSKQCPTAER